MRRLAFFLVLALSLGACKKETAEEPQPQPTPQPDPVVYDLTSEMSNPDTAELEFMKDWEKFEQVPINKGGSLSQESTPWSTGLVKTALPTFLCHDVKKDGGWDSFVYMFRTVISRNLRSDAAYWIDQRKIFFYRAAVELKNKKIGWWATIKQPEKPYIKVVEFDVEYRN